LQRYGREGGESIGMLIDKAGGLVVCFARDASFLSFFYDRLCAWRCQRHDAEFESGKVHFPEAKLRIK
jgi:hypothetical protein